MYRAKAIDKRISSPADNERTLRANTRPPVHSAGDTIPRILRDTRNSADSFGRGVAPVVAGRQRSPTDIVTIPPEPIGVTMSRRHPRVPFAQDAPTRNASFGEHMVGHDGERVTRNTRLIGYQTDGRNRSAPTVGGSLMLRGDARGIGAITATSIRMGDRARAAAVRSAPNHWR